jgi:very-short-patch-repair endonuclease
LVQRCRELRQTATDAESLLWELLRDRGFLDAKFRRQHVFHGYILDFYCHEAGLAIELDGGVHAAPAQAARDRQRDADLERAGIRTLRFFNSQVMDDPQAVLEAVGAALTPPTPLSQGERGEKASSPPLPLGEGAGGEGRPHRREIGPGGEDHPHRREIGPRGEGHPASSPPLPPGEGAGGEGHPPSLYIPSGVLIPCIAAGQVWYLKIALLPGQPVRCERCRKPAHARRPCPECGALNKYRGVRGNRTSAIFGADELTSGGLALFVEGEFDAMLAWQELHDVIAVCTLGSAANLPDLATWGPWLAPLDVILAAYDSDAAGERGAAALQSLSERVTRVSLPPGAKDINEYILQGGQLWPWLKAIVEAGWQD